jgi:hypothetical protein
VARHLEIKMIVVATSGIELRATAWATTFAVHILMDGQLYTAGATKYGSLAPFRREPDFDLMISKRVMTILASIVDATALHFDRINVSGSVIVLATGLWIEIDATNFWKSRHHGLRRKRDLHPIVSNSS